jgi:hypothetical protein
VSLRRPIVNIVYVDDSGSDKPSPIVVVGAVVVNDAQYCRMDWTAGAIVETLLPPEKRAVFDEFHAAHLFGGFGIFNDVSQDARFAVLRALLRTLPKFGFTFVYGAVDKQLLGESVFGSASAQDIAFRLCICGAADHLSSKVNEKLAAGMAHEDQVRIATEPFLVVADDTSDKELKRTLSASFRALRPMAYAKNAEEQRLVVCHDDMYFGDSKYSIGIQLADVCAHTMLRYFRDGNAADEFFQLIEPHTVCARPMPMWAQCRAFTKAHDDEPRDLTLSALLQATAADSSPASGPPEHDTGQS